MALILDIDTSAIIIVLSAKYTLGGNIMASAKNKVIAGDYKRGSVVLFFGTPIIKTGILSGRKRIRIDSSTVESYEVVDESSKTSASSAVSRAAVGGCLLGPIGWFAALSAKKKGIHTVSIQFKDGHKSLLEVNDKIYKAIIAKVF